MRHHGLGSLLLHGLKGEKEIEIASLTSVQIKRPGITNGYIQFAYPGSVESKKGHLRRRPR